jgi:hypothetical protein
MYIGLNVKYPLFLSHLNEACIFSTDFSKILKNFIKICPVGAEFHAEGQTDRKTDMTKLKVTFRNFANAPKKLKTVPILI